MVSRILVVLIAVSIACSGCGKKSPQVNTEENQPAPVQVLFGEIQELMSQEKPEEALARLEKAMTEEVFENDKPQIFASILAILLQTGQTGEAVERHLATAKTAPDLAAFGYNVMERGLASSTNTVITLDWTSQLLESPVDQQTRSRVYVLQSYLLLREEREQEAVDILNSCIEELDLNLSIQTAGRIIDIFLSNAKPETTETAIQRLEALNKDDLPEIKEITTVARLRLLMAKKDWQSFVKLFSDNLSIVSDREVESLINGAYRLLKDNDPSTAEQICKTVIIAGSPEDRSFYTASRLWLTIISDQKPAEIPDCVNIIRTAGLSDEKVFSAIGHPYYALLSSSNPEKLKEMLTILTDIREGLNSERDSNAINNMLLDGSFTLKDYDTAISMLEQGIGGKDDAWRESAIAKLKAHRAMDAGNHEEAIKYFRDFMNAISESMTSETDPSTGMVYTKAWCLARNAKRIGDLYKEQGLKDQAASAYTEAKGHFEEALKEFKENSAEHKALAEEIVEIPEG